MTTIRLLTLSLAAALGLLMGGCSFLEARYVPVCEGNPITTPCLGYCNVHLDAPNGVRTTQRLPFAVLITDQEGHTQCQAVKG